MDRSGENDVKHPILRRDFIKLANAVGLTAAFGGLSAAYAANEIPTKEFVVAQANKEKKEEMRKSKTAKYTLRAGIAGHTPEGNCVYNGGFWQFKRDIEERTDGEVQVELLGANTICNELTCTPKVLSGVLPCGYATVENASATVPFFAVIDFPYLWPSSASFYYFAYSSEGNEVFRKILMEKFGLVLLWMNFEQRSIFLGPKYKNTDKRYRVPADTKGMKIRVTGSPLITIAFEQMGLNPIPLNWSETLEGLKSGVVDGMETSDGAVAAFAMTPFVSQDIRIDFVPNVAQFSFNRSAFDRLPTRIQEDIFESAFVTQMWTQYRKAWARPNLIGSTDPPNPGTFFQKYNVKVNELTDAEKKEWIKLGSPHANPKPYESWRGKIKQLAGGKDVYEAVYNIARNIPEDTKLVDVVPHRWWKTTPEGFQPVEPTPKV